MFAVLALLVGVVLGAIFEPSVPLVLQPYLPIAVVAALVEGAPPATEAAVPEPVPDEEPAREWDVDGPDTAAGTEPVAAPQPTTRQRRLSTTGALIGLLLVLFGFAFVVQLRSHAADPGLTTARPEDLVRILSDLDARKDRLSQEISQLRTTQQQLAAGSQGRAAALDAAAKR